MFWRRRANRRWIGSGKIALLVACLAQVRPLASQCAFDHPIDPNKQMMGLVQDYNAYSEDVCKENCCNDPSCTAYQFQQGFHGQMSCMRGAESKDLMVRRPNSVPHCRSSHRLIRCRNLRGTMQDSGGMPWQGEAGRGGGDDGKSTGGSGADDDEWATTRDGTFSLVGLFCIYMLLGTAYGSTHGKQGAMALPHPHVWRELRGLVVDGWQFFFYDRRANYVPVPLADGGADDGKVAVEQILGQRSSTGTMGGHGPRGTLPLQIQAGQGLDQAPAVIMHSPPGVRTGAGARGKEGRSSTGGTGTAVAGSATARSPGDMLALVPTGAGSVGHQGPTRQKLRKKKGATSAAARLPVKPHVVNME